MIASPAADVIRTRAASVAFPMSSGTALSLMTSSLMSTVYPAVGCGVGRVEASALGCC